MNRHKFKERSIDEKQFQEWWGDIEPALIKSATRMVHDEGRDVVQNVSILALRNFDRFARYDDFARWCHIRTRYLALDELARVKRLGKNPIDPETLLAPTAVDPYGELRPLINNLPERQRTVVLYKLAGYRTDEIGEKMNISMSSVRSHWRHAQINLAEQN